MKRLTEADAIVALAYVMPDTPIRTLAETILRLYENGYALVAPSPETDVTETERYFETDRHFSVWHTKEDQCGDPLQGTAHRHQYQKEGRG